VRLVGASRLVAIALVAAATACGSEAGREPEPATVDDPTAELELTVWPRGRASGNPQTWTLRCDPARGTHPKPAEACARLTALAGPFAPPAPGEICTEQYGGPQEALIEGTYRGERVRFALSRTNGCEIARFERLAFLLPVSAAA
jgi:hypothetical protein